VYSGSTLNHNYTGNTDRIKSDLKSSPKGIKVDGEVIISGGNINVNTTGNGGEGIESKTILTISGGNVFVQAYDDAINSSSHMYISGGNVTAIGRSNDGLDSNGNMYISGGVVRAFGARSPECGLDANEEEGYSVVFTGGMILGVGGSNSVPSTSSSTQPYLTSSISVSAGQTLTVKSGDEVLATFEIPAEYNPSSSSWRPAPPMMVPPPGGMSPMMGPGGWGGGPGGQNAGPVLISLPSLTKSKSYTITNGTSTSTSTAK
ncbi:MAG: carbohydrate-binding domain-containing protein, partial [Muribaculaceae bacterium]|nr:carbohydrate-binding domain-containing protein [Muribaculaceae bacterium]